MKELVKVYKKKRAFKGASEEELKILVDLGKNCLPDDLILFFKEAMPEKEVKMGDYVLYPIARVEDENTKYIPGADLCPLGLFTFASTLDGDAICVDTTKPDGRIYQCSHSLLSEDGISFYKGKMIHLDFNYDNVIKCSVELAANFKEYMEWIITGKRESFSVIDYVLENYTE